LHEEEVQIDNVEPLFINDGEVDGNEASSSDIEVQRSLFDALALAEDILAQANLEEGQGNDEVSSSTNAEGRHVDWL